MPRDSKWDCQKELEPFRTLDFGQFAAFLRQAEQYRNSGSVSVPSLESLNAEKVQTSLRRAVSLADRLSGADRLDVQQVSAEREAARHELEQVIGAFLKPLAINASLKSDQKEFQAILKKGSPRTLAGQVREALEGVTDAASLHAPERQEKLRAVAAQLQQADLRAIATELGAPASGRTKEALLSAIITRITGIRPTARKTTRTPRAPAVDQSAVQQQAVKLEGLVEKSLDPPGLSGAELEAAISELETRSVAELQAIAREVGLEKVGKSTEGILKTIREKLQEAERARDSIQV